MVLGRSSSRAIPGLFRVAAAMESELFLAARQPPIVVELSLSGTRYAIELSALLALGSCMTCVCVLVCSARIRTVPALVFVVPIFVVRSP